MNRTIENLLKGKTENHVLPFFWQHGEDEQTLRKYMAVIQEAGCGAVCVESRPHPDFCGPGWWHDMDIILDEAVTRGMKVWILDDSHFPTGYAAGAVRKAPARLCRQNIYCNTARLANSAGPINLKASGLLDPPKYRPGEMESSKRKIVPARCFDDDRILSVSARNESTGEVRDLTGFVKGTVLDVGRLDSHWELRVCVASRNTGYHRDYINMLDRESCRLLPDTVYEAHWRHYAKYFGNTIEGFFSDEPEFGNGLLYAMGNVLGTRQDLPWSDETEEKFAARIGEGWRAKLPLLWEPGDPDETAAVRYHYMDCITRIVREDFSYQLGDWCRKHHVKYIGHIIEDNGQHCRTGSSLGHYFRSLEGQDMSGIDDIAGQVMPQCEDAPVVNSYGGTRKSVFYHYGLGKLAQSAAAIEPRKKNRAMCELFGNYGWSEGVQLEKYLTDHFLVRGINYFVPHAFSPKAFPDPDCPPHFYAQGHNPQYRCFGKLMAYLNRAATLTSSGRAVVPVGILYHGESEWADSHAMPFEQPLRVLYDRQIDCHVLPGDIFERRDFYHTEIGRTLRVNGQEYRYFLVPAAEYLRRDVAEGLDELRRSGMPVLFVDRRPGRISEGGDLPEGLRSCPVVPLDKLADRLCAEKVPRPLLNPPDDRIRILHLEGENPVYLIINEAAHPYSGELTLPSSGGCYGYDAWENHLVQLAAKEEKTGTVLKLTVEPRKSLFVLFDDELNGVIPQKPLHEGKTVCYLNAWTRSVCEATEYPDFRDQKSVTLPDRLAREKPEFSGFVRYETTFKAEQTRGLGLTVTDAAEGVTLYVNGRCAGTQIVPPYRFDLTELIRPGENTLQIEVATTLEREWYQLLDPGTRSQRPEPVSQSGITGKVRLFRKQL
jgi:hypothetical protein